MKGLYLIWPDYEYVDKAIAAGIDTLLVSCYDYPDDGQPSNHFDNYASVLATCARYKGQVKIYLVPVYVREWLAIPENQRYIKGGLSYPHTPCPTSVDYITSRCKIPYDLYCTGKIDGVIYDIEQYGEEVPTFKKQNQCECSRCIGLTWEQQWQQHKDIMMTLFPIKAVGQMPYDSWWTLNNYVSKPLLLTADTYNYTGSMIQDRFKLWLGRLINGLFHKADYKIVAGVFLEVLTEDEFFTALQKINKSSLFDGWWIYTQKRLSRNSKMDEAGAKPLKNATGRYDLSLVGDQFFERLKVVCR